MAEKEAQHLGTGVRPLGIGVGTVRTAARPGMAGTMNLPLFQDRLAVGIGIPGARTQRATRYSATGRGAVGRDSIDAGEKPGGVGHEGATVMGNVTHTIKAVEF